MAGLNIDLTANLARWTSSLDRAIQDLNRFQTNTNRISGNISKLFTGLIPAVSFAGLTALTKNALAFGDTIEETSKKLGVTAEGLQRLQYTGNLLNTTSEGMTEAFKSFNNTLGLAESGSAKAQRTIGALGS